MQKHIDSWLGSETGAASSGDLLTAESDHRIANSLALIAGLLRLQASALAKTGSPISPEVVEGELLEAAGRVTTVASLHRRLPHDGEVDLAEIVRDVAEVTLGSLARPGQARLCVTAPETCVAPARLVLPISLVVGELVTNSLKYAHPAGVEGQIRVACRRERVGGFLVEVGDDGVGLPDGLDPMASGGFGFRLVRTLARQIKAELTFRDEGLGLVVRMSVPAGETPPAVRQST